MDNPDFTWSDGSLETRLYIQKAENEYPCGFEISLFNTTRHQNTQTTHQRHSFYLLRPPHHEAIASISYSEGSEKTFVSPARAPFGGLQSHPDCTIHELTFFLSCVEKWMQNNAAKSLTIKEPPFCYDPALSHKLHHIYLTNGYLPTVNISHHIEITGKDFRLSIKKSECRRLNKCMRAGFTFNLDKMTSPQVIFNFIEKSYRSKHYKLSITEQQFHMLASTFPEKFLVFTIIKGAQLITVGIALRIRKNSIYLFILADLLAYRTFSPIVLLYDGIYAYCQKEGIELLDLGTSADHQGIIKPGLISFKENMGGTPSFKISYQKIFN